MQTMASLEVRAKHLALRAGAQDWPKFMDTLASLKQHNPRMYAHSLRVGIYAYGLAKIDGYDDRFALYAGCGHDLGKVDVPNIVLDAEHFGECERAQCRVHPTTGFDRLCSAGFMFSGLVAGLHHKLQPNGYGIDLEHDCPTDLTNNIRTSVTEITTVVMTADFYDALTTRDNEKGYVKNFGDPTEERTVMERLFPAYPRRVHYLCTHKIV